MVTARRTGTSENVSTYGVARTYSALATWEAATDNDLVTATTSEVLECYDDAASYNDTVSIAGATTSALYFRIIRPAAGQGHDGTSNNGVFFDVTANANVFFSTENYFQAQDLIAKSTQNVDSTRYCFRADAVGVKFIGCISFDSSNVFAGRGVRGFYLNNADGQTCVLCLANNNDDIGFICLTPVSTNSYIYNCTAQACTYGFYDSSSAGTINIKNCLGAANSSNDYFDAGAMSATNCASSDASSPDATRRSKTFTFVSVAGDDFHLDAADTGAKDDGTDLSADGTFAFDDDIDGDLYNTWDIGFDENSPAGGAEKVPSNRYQSVVRTSPQLQSIYA